MPVDTGGIETRPRECPVHVANAHLGKKNRHIPGRVVPGAGDSSFHLRAHQMLLELANALLADAQLALQVGLPLPQVADSVDELLKK